MDSFWLRFRHVDTFAHSVTSRSTMCACRSRTTLSISIRSSRGPRPEGRDDDDCNPAAVVLETRVVVRPRNLGCFGPSQFGIQPWISGVGGLYRRNCLLGRIQYCAGVDEYGTLLHLLS